MKTKIEKTYIPGLGNGFVVRETSTGDAVWNVLWPTVQAARIQAAKLKGFRSVADYYDSTVRA